MKHTQTAGKRLAALLNTKDFIPYHTDIPDREFPHIKLSIYGAVATNELFVKLTNGRTTFIDVVESPLCFPIMADRVFGMDVADANTAFALANEMWERHKDILIVSSDKLSQQDEAAP